MTSSDEYEIYYLAVKSMVDNMDRFLTNLNTNNIPINDELFIRFENMSKNLQRIIGKSSNKQRNNKADTSLISPSTPDQVSISESSIMKSIFDLNSSKPDTKEKSSDELEEEQKLIIEKTKREVQRIVGDSSDDEDYPLIEETFELKCTKKSKLHNDVSEEEFKINTQETIKKISLDVYLCTICKVHLPKNNVVSHENGRQHKNMLTKQLESVNTSRESSLNRNTSDIRTFLKGIDKELTENENGQFITNGQCYVCNLCNADMMNEMSVKQHVLGSKHKRLAGIE